MINCLINNNISYSQNVKKKYEFVELINKNKKTGKTYEILKSKKI